MTHGEREVVQEGPIDRQELKQELEIWIEQGEGWKRAAQRSNSPHTEGLAEGGIRVARRIAERFNIVLDEPSEST